jgi:hypothetical protein
MLLLFAMFVKIEDGEDNGNGNGLMGDVAGCGSSVVGSNAHCSVSLNNIDNMAAGSFDSGKFFLSATYNAVL